MAEVAGAVKMASMGQGGWLVLLTRPADGRWLAATSPKVDRSLLSAIPDMHCSRQAMRNVELRVGNVNSQVYRDTLKSSVSTQLASRLQAASLV